MFSEVQCIVSGKVQSVGYRDFVQTIAGEKRLTGSVRNRDDGTVAVCFQGSPDELKECIEALHVGPPLAHVDSVGVDWRTPKTQLEDFKILF